jgi:hypothetical protein
MLGFHSFDSGGRKKWGKKKNGIAYVDKTVPFFRGETLKRET